MLPEPVARAVQLAEGRRPGRIEAEQFEESGLGAQPGLGGALGGGMDHAGGDEGGGQGGGARGKPLAQQGGAKVQGIQGEKSNAFGADGAVAGILEGLQVNGGEVGIVEGQALDEQVMDALGALEQLGVGGDEGLLAGGEVLDQLDEPGPEGFGHGEVGAEVEQVDLADAAGGADGADEAEGGVVAAGLAGAGADLADEHWP